MMKRKLPIYYFTALWLTLQVAVIAETASRTEVAALPYAVAYKMAQASEPEGTSANGKGLAVKFKSNLPGVNPKDINLFIDSKSGRILLSLGVDGSFHLPVSDSLIKENPQIISNQPKGSMSLDGYIERNLSVPENRILHYRELMQPLRLAAEMKAAIVTTNETPSVETLEALVIRVQDHGRSNVFIQSKSGVIEITGGEYGIYQIPFEAELMKEDPDVVLPGRVAWIVCHPFGKEIGGSNKGMNGTR